MSYRYWEVGTRHWEYATEPTSRCPLATAETKSAPGMDAAAHALGVDPGKLARVIGTHHSGYGSREREEDGTLTDRCTTCGHKMDRLGFAVKITDVDPDQDSSRARINSRLFGGELRTPLAFKYLPTRKAAKEWCYSRYTDAKKNGVPSA
jgi:predicted pyridoxine 5'-phosphate oxidase superfamily flavin-nucleotide-binding protein